MLHEIGHMLMHQFDGSQCEPSKDERLRADRLSRLAPHLDPAAVSRILTRDHCSTVEEREAEMIASLILERVDRNRPASFGEGTAGRLGQALGTKGPRAAEFRREPMGLGWPRLAGFVSACRGLLACDRARRRRS